MKTHNFCKMMTQDGHNITQKILILCGEPGSGKTALAYWLIKNVLPFMACLYDDLRKDDINTRFYKDAFDKMCKFIIITTNEVIEYKDIYEPYRENTFIIKLKK